MESILYLLQKYSAFSLEKERKHVTKNNCSRNCFVVILARMVHPNCFFFQGEEGKKTCTPKSLAGVCRGPHRPMSVKRFGPPIPFTTKVTPPTRENLSGSLSIENDFALHSANGRGGFGLQTAADPLATSAPPSELRSSEEENPPENNPPKTI